MQGDLAGVGALYTLTEKGRDEVKAILSANKVTAKEQLAM